MTPLDEEDGIGEMPNSPRETIPLNNSTDESVFKREVPWLQERLSPQRNREKSEDIESALDNDSNNFLAEMDALRAEINRSTRHPTLRAIRTVLEHRYCHYSIITLVIFDVFLVVSSLLVEIRTVEMKCQEHLRRAQESEALSIGHLQSYCNETGTNSALAALAIIGVQGNITNQEIMANATARIQELLIIMLGAFDFEQLGTLEFVEVGLHFTGLAIISIFVVEVTLKLIAFFPEFFRSKIDVLDMLLVYISFVCEMALSVSDVRLGVREAVFVAMLLRLWRIARIVSGVVISMKTKYEGEIIRLKAKLKAAQSGSRSSLCNNGPATRTGFFRLRQFSEANFSVIRERFQLKSSSKTADETQSEPNDDSGNQPPGEDEIDESSPNSPLNFQPNVNV